MAASPRRAGSGVEWQPRRSTPTRRQHWYGRSPPGSTVRCATPTLARGGPGPLRTTTPVTHTNPPSPDPATRPATDPAIGPAPRHVHDAHHVGPGASPDGAERPAVLGPAPEPHPWFRSTTGSVVMSHHGRIRRSERPGSLDAIKGAYAAGFRWFQIDVVPIDGDLVSLHAVFGRRWGFGRMTLAQVRAKLGYDVPTLSQLLDDPELRDARWNVEVKSRAALPALIATLKRTEAVSRVMVSAPMHRSVIREVRETFGTLVAVTAPVHHGGTFGRRFLSPKLEHDGLQVHRWFAVPAQRRHGRGRVRVQSWTIDGLDQLDACLDAGCHPVVRRSDDEVRRHLATQDRWPTVPTAWKRFPGRQQLRRVPPRPKAADRPIEVVLLGGGGWRGAFGSIGTVAYLHTRGWWTDVRHVVGISGGSFVAGVLGAADVDDTDPTPALAGLASRMMRLRTRMWGAAALAVVPPVGVAAAVAVAAPGWWLVAVPTTVLFWVRVAISRSWVAMLRSLFGRGVPQTSGPRRYVVCATGRSSARPHFFVAGDLRDLEQPVPGLDAATSDPWGRIVPTGWDWTDAVSSSTALPWVNGFRTEPDPTLGDAGRAERLIDGGVVGIFGRQWFDRTLLGTSPGDRMRTLAVDTGRRHRTSGRLVERAMGLFTVGLMSRWVQIALDASFRKEIERASRAEAEVGPDAVPMMNLVRVAETDVADHHDIRAMKNEALRRLEHGRCIVRRFGLMGLSRRNCLVTIVVAVVACMFDLEHDPSEDDVRERLLQVGGSLGLDTELAEIWDGL